MRALRIILVGIAVAVGPGAPALLAAKSTDEAVVLASPSERASSELASTVDVAAFSMPYSPFASEEAKNMFVERVLVSDPYSGPDIARARHEYDAIDQQRVAHLRARFDVDIEQGRMGGVSVQIVTPKGGVTDTDRILVNLHGGGFLVGSGNGALVEAIPIAARSGLKVITVDYRLAPEARFPAASEDVAAVYQVLLADYDPKSIGIYGCSAGAMLTAQSLVWFQQHDLPRPGAVGMFCFGAAPALGDAAYFGPISTGSAPGGGLSFENNPYFAGASPTDPAALPILSDEALAAFPPVLLISGTRDFGLSSVLATQAALTRNGVDARLHVWDGMWHSFMSDPEPRESGEAYDVVSSFFKKTLATGNTSESKSEGE